MTDLAAFGEARLDLTARDDERIETADRFECHVAGPEASAAVAAQRLGATSAWLSKVPDSPLGRRAIGELRRHGLAVEAVRDDGRQGIAFREHSGEPRGTTIHYDRDDTAFASVAADDMNLSVVRDARLFYTTGVTPAVSDAAAEATANLLGVARNAGTRTAMGLAYRPGLWSTDRARATLAQLFQAVDVLLAPTDDARRVFGMEGEEPQAMGHSLASEYDFETVVLHGRDDVVALQGDVLHERDTIGTEGTRPFGVDGAFDGVFLARRLAGDEVDRAIEYAAATAALKRTIPGDLATITRSEVEDVMRGK